MASGNKEKIETPGIMLRSKELFFDWLSTTLSIVYILTAFISKNKRHMADILAGSTVVKNHSQSESENNGIIKQDI